MLAERNGRSSLLLVIGQQLAREARQTADRLSTLIRVERESLESFARQDVMREIRVSDLDKRIAQALSTLVSGASARLGYFVIDEDARVVAISAPAIADFAPEDVVARRGTTGIVGFAPGPDGKTALILAAPIPDPDRSQVRLGTLFALIDWNRLSGVTDQVRRELGEQGIPVQILVVETEGQILRASPEGVQDASVADSIERAIGDPGAEPGYSVDREAEQIVGHAALAWPSGWSLLVVEPLAHALAPAVRLRNRLAMTTALALAIALVIAGVGADRVIRPLSELTRAIRGLARAEPSTLQVPVRSDDEVGVLAASFNSMAAELDETQRHLVEAEKFAFVGELAAGVAHEVRTSLGVLGNAAKLLGRSLAEPADPNVREMIDMIRAEVDRLSRVVDDLLTLDHRRPLDPRPTPLSLPLCAAVDFVAPGARHQGIEVEIVRADPDPIVRCDRDAIQQVCINLLSNALASLSTGGHVKVQIERVSRTLAAFSVRDDGPGVPAALRERIFDPFVTGRASGVGLGLTFVKRVVAAHRGTVRLESREGAGACFRVELPIEEVSR
ncbi:MAG: sensor histidine kinase [Myxococcota bacterium]